MCYQSVQLIILFLVFYTISFSLKADLNTGISISIWSITPIIQGVMDYMIFSVSLKRSQIIGIFLISICVALIGLRDVLIKPEYGVVPTVSPLDLGLDMKNETIQVAHGKIVIVSKVPTIVPIIFALMTPIAFSVSGSLAKHLS